MVDKKSALSNTPAVLAATGGFITAIVGLLTFMSAPAPSIGEFDASPNIIAIGESSVLKWSVTGDGATVMIEPDIGLVALSGTRVVAPSNTTNYTLTAKNKEQEKIASVQIVVREKNESKQMINETTGSVAVKSEMPMAQQVDTQPTQEQRVIYVPIPASAEPSNPEVSAVTIDVKPQDDPSTPPSDSKTIVPTQSSVTNPSEIEQSTVVAPAAIIVPNDANAGDVPSQIVQDAAEAEPTSMPPNDHVESAPAQPGTTEMSNSAAQNNESGNDDLIPSETGSNEEAAEQKSVKKITAADWDSLSNESGSSEDFQSNAPIYAKIGGTGSVPADDSDFQDSILSDQGLSSTDYLGHDIQSQDASLADMHLPGTSGPDSLTP